MTARNPHSPNPRLFLCLQTGVCVCVSHSVTSDSVTPWTIAHQTPLSMGFSRQERWSGLPCLPLGDLPDPGIEPGSPALQTDCLLSEPPAKQGMVPSFLGS